MGLWIIIIMIIIKIIINEWNVKSKMIGLRMNIYGKDKSYV